MAIKKLLEKLSDGLKRAQRTRSDVSWWRKQKKQPKRSAKVTRESHQLSAVVNLNILQLGPSERTTLIFCWDQHTKILVAW